jgi:asparagine synthase (glutamine-hydrolysing)
MLSSYDEYHKEFNSLCLTSQLCGIPFKDYPFKNCGQVNGSTYGTYIINKESYTIKHILEKTESIRDISITIFDEEEACNKIYNTLNKIIEDFMVSDRPIGFNTSGGLDSSLITGIFKHINDKNNLNGIMNTFCIGLEGGTDEKYAKMVGEHVKSNHTHILCTEEEFINCAENEITEIIESYDITTNRASVPQLISAKKIKELTDCKVVFVGDYADEVCGGYNITKYKKTPEEYSEAIYKLLEEIIYYDGQ